MQTAISYALLIALLVCSTVQHIGDRSRLLMLLMFVPVTPLALWALLWDARRRGHALRVRWSLTLLALGAEAVALGSLWRPARAPERGGTGERVRLLQWNTLWGGRGPQQLADVLDRIDALQPDVVFLSEAPRNARLRRAWSERHAGWYLANTGSREDDAYWYNLTVLSRRRVQLRQEWTLQTGHAALFDVQLPARSMRVLLADLQSSPILPRSPSIRQLAQLVEARARGPEAVDVVLGDFNTPGHFLGFDALAAAGGGFRRAALWSGQWRGTWPSFLPLPMFDIDHVWVSARWRVQSAEIFSGPPSDHRGQRVDLRAP